MNRDFMCHCHGLMHFQMYSVPEAGIRITFFSRQMEQHLQKHISGSELEFCYFTEEQKTLEHLDNKIGLLTLMSACEDKDLAMDFIKYITGSEFHDSISCKMPGGPYRE